VREDGEDWSHWEVIESEEAEEEDDDDDDDDAEHWTIEQSVAEYLQTLEDMWDGLNVMLARA